MNKIKLYILSEILKSCSLIFFIFVSIAWLLQISRLISTLNNLQIQLLDILWLSIHLLPNLITVVFPFIIIFGIVLTYLRLNNERELLGIYSLGLSIKNITQPLFHFSIISIIFYSFFIFYFSPYSYEKFKSTEYNLRNNVIFDNIQIPNFIKVENKTIIDFDSKLKNIFINYKDQNIDNVIFAKDGIIKYANDKYIFNLINGFKIKILDNEIEKLEFENYKFSITKRIKKYIKNSDSNTVTIFESIKSNDFVNIINKFSDICILILIFLFFHSQIIKNNNFKFNNIFIFILISIIFLLVNYFIKNLELSFYLLSSFYSFQFFLLIITIYFCSYVSNK